jgi:hypothetical protein
MVHFLPQFALQQLLKAFLNPRVMGLSSLLVPALILGCGGGKKPDNPDKPKPPGETDEERKIRLETEARKAEFDRLSKPFSIEHKTIEVKQLSDFSQSWGYDKSAHKVFTFDFRVFTTITDPELKRIIEEMVYVYNNCINQYSSEHEYRHGYASKWTHTIKNPQNFWKTRFLDEVSAFLSETMLFRKNMLDAYIKYISEGGNPAQFSAISFWKIWEYDFTHHKMALWYDVNGNFAQLMSGVSQTEAAQLISCYYDRFCDVFDFYRNGINYAFNSQNPIVISYDKDEYFQNIVFPAMFTYKVDNADTNLWQIQGQTARDDITAKLHAKMEEEYAKWLAGE